MKTLERALIVYISFLVFCFLIQSCCTDPDRFRIVDRGQMSFFVNQDGSAVSELTDTISGEFVMSVSFETELVETFNQFDMFSKAYAYSCDEEFENALDESTLTLRCSEDFVYNGATVNSNTNFLNLPELQPLIIGELGLITIPFNEDFMENVEFENGQTTFTLEIQTTDSLELSTASSVIIDL